jgi:hypothetical protein
MRWKVIELRRIRSFHEQPEPMAAPPVHAFDPRQRRAVALVAHGAVLLQFDAFAPGAPWALQRDRGQTLATAAV